MPTMYFEQKRFRAAKSRKCPSHLFDDGNREGTFCVETRGPVAFLQRLAFFERGYLMLKSGVSSMQRSQLHLGSVYDPGVAPQGMSDTPICVVPLVVPEACHYSPPANPGPALGRQWSPLSGGRKVGSLVACCAHQPGPQAVVSTRPSGYSTVHTDPPAVP